MLPAIWCDSMEKLKQILRDLALALAIGLGTGLVLCLLVWGIGAWIGGGMRAGASAARSAVLLTGGIILLAAAALLLKGGNLPDEAFRIRTKKEPFSEERPPQPLHLYRRVPRPYTMLTVAIGVLLVSILPDLVLLAIL